MKTYLLNDKLTTIFDFLDIKIESDMILLNLRHHVEH
jgi:hypothetical protein